LKHAEVTHVKTLTGHTEWVTVTLQDNTQLTVTANHPMKPVSSSADGLLHDVDSVFAKDLQPGSHHLMALRVVPVTVTDVQPSDCKDPRVAVNVRQPERHAIFVVGGGQAAVGALQSMGVESATPAKPLLQRVKQTFVEVVDEGSSGDGQSLQRASSSPALLSTSPQQECEHVDVVEVRNHSNHGSCSSSSVSSLSANVIVGNTISLGRDAADDAALRMKSSSLQVVALSTMLQARAASIPSVGSINHATGACDPCVFEMRRGQGSCFKGTLCGRCHVMEGHISYKELKQSKRRQEQSKKREQKLEV